MTRTLAAAALLLTGTTALAATSDIIRGIPAGSGWAREVKKVVVSLFDADGSGALDTQAEVDSVGCDVWKAVDDGVRRDWSGQSVLAIYGFAGDTIWLGTELGVAPSMKDAAAAALGRCGIAEGQSGGVQGGTVQPQGGTAGVSIAPAIRQIPGGDSTTWADAVEKAFLASYDANRNGAVESLSELGAVPCDTWTAMDEGVRRDWGGTGLRTIYGFDPDFIWVGDVFSIDESLRTATVIATSSCGVGDPLAQPADAIAGLPEGGQDPWDGFVRRALLAAFDSNRSGALDTVSELQAVGCPAWQAIDDGVRQGWQSGVRQVYGFEASLLWVGSAIGVAEPMRAPADQILKGCGLTALADGSEGASTLPRGPLTQQQAVSAIIASRPDTRDATVIQVMQQLYDLDGDGMIDTGKELKGIPCTIFAAIDQSVREEYTSSVRQIYGFEKGYIWVGYAFNIEEKLRKAADKALVKCGIGR